MSRVFGLDLLRAIAVLMVLVAHARFGWPGMNRHFDASIFGFLGVELFFVLSGFLIGGILLRTMPGEPGLSDLRTFWVRRWFRTLPNYYLFLGLNLALVSAIATVPSGVAPYAVFLQNFTTDTLPFYNESWSLAVEEWFYLAFPLLMFLFLRLGLRAPRACLAALLVLLLGATGARVLAATVLDVPWSVARKAVVYRLDALMVGVLAAYWKAHHPGGWERSRVPAAGASAGLFALVAWAYVHGADDSFFRRTFLFNATSFAVFGLLPGLDSWRTSSGLLAAAVERISVWSYSLYLCHLPLLVLMTSVVGRPGRASGLPPALWLLLWAGTAVATAAFVFHFFERPTTDLRARFEGSGRLVARPVRSLG